MTTTTRAAIAVPDAPDSPMAQLRWTFADAWTLTLRGISYWVRQPLQVVAGWAFMIMLVALYGLLFGGAMRVPDGGSYMEFLMPGMFVMTMAFGIGETMSAVSVDAERGVTDRFRSMPMASSAVVLGRSFTDMIYSTVGLVVMIGAGLVLGWRWHGGLEETLAAFGLLLLLRFAMLWVGIFLGLIVPGPIGGELGVDHPVPADDGHRRLRATGDDARVARLHRGVEPADGHDLRDARPVREPGGRRNVVGGAERDPDGGRLAGAHHRGLPATLGAEVSEAESVASLARRPPGTESAGVCFRVAARQGTAGRD